MRNLLKLLNLVASVIFLVSAVVVITYLVNSFLSFLVDISEKINILTLLVVMVLTGTISSIMSFIINKNEKSKISNDFDGPVADQYNDLRSGIDE